MSMTDRDSFQCDCGHTLMRRKEVDFYTFKLIKLGEEPQNPAESQ
jgi:hypothetical protein